MDIKSICVFCASSPGNSTVFAEKAADIGKIIAEKRMRLVYGGGSIGLMKVTARAALDGGAEVIGVIPQLISNKVRPFEEIKTIVVETMHERKTKMYELSDAFIALPGGIGTMEELLEVFTWKQIGYHTKPVGILNTLGYYDSFISLLDNAVSCGFMKQRQRESLIISESPEELIQLVEIDKHLHVDKWAE
ncbi:MAG: TIGR00730 family Rossman fold protein [Spirochaetia bacterium]|jgi:uncharacterized protein (TIGR00730 family)|nr:TIGR00730 family Rossman fold protein [Spirochaetia bacterium]